MCDGERSAPGGIAPVEREKREPVTRVLTGDRPKRRRGRRLGGQMRAREEAQGGRARRSDREVLASLQACCGPETSSATLECLVYGRGQAFLGVPRVPGLYTLFMPGHKHEPCQGFGRDARGAGVHCSAVLCRFRGCHRPNGASPPARFEPGPSALPHSPCASHRLVSGWAPPGPGDGKAVGTFPETSGTSDVCQGARRGSAPVVGRRQVETIFNSDG